MTSKKEVRKDFFGKVEENPVPCLELDTIKICVCLCVGGTVYMWGCVSRGRYACMECTCVYVVWCMRRGCVWKMPRWKGVWMCVG